MSNQNFIKFDTGAATKKVKEAVGELKQLDDILNEISHVSGLTGAQLKELGDSAFDAADKYGKSADKYLESVRKMYQAGQRNAAQMAELSLCTKQFRSRPVQKSEIFLTFRDKRSSSGAWTPRKVRTEPGWWHHC